MKKGFTLIEVLGVIILLGLLALIVFPSVVNQMKKIDSNINESTKKIIYIAADEYISDNNDKYQDNFDYNSFIVVEIENLINDGYLADNIDVKDYKFVKINIEKGNSSSYTVIKELDQYDLFDNGEVVYFNPTTGKKCNENDYKINLNNYSTTNTLSDGTKSPTGLKSGCMKWYAFNDNIDNGLVNLLLDHNTSGNVAWSTSGTKMKEVADRLKSDTDSWSDSLIINKVIDNFDYEGYKARLITADEVAQITGADEALQWASVKSYSTTVTIGTNISDYYLDGSFGTDLNWKTKIADSSNKSKFSWLYDNMNGCVDYGCNIADSNTYQYGTENSGKYGYIYGYWTSTIEQKNDLYYAWEIHRTGNFMLNATIDNNIVQGLRTVIMVNKEIFE